MRLLLVATLLSLPVYAPANGGGYQHGIRFTGTPSPFEPSGTEHVQIVDEQLNIRLAEEEAHVEVRYRMRNTRDAKTKVTFGFPVETVPPLLPNPTGKPPADVEDQVNRYCRNYTVHADAKPVRAKYATEPYGKSSSPEFPGAEILEEIQGWMISTLTFKPSQVRDVVIRYDSTYHTSHWFISNTSRTPPRTFRYRLSTGGVWAGPIKSGTVRVTVAGAVDPEAVRVHTPPNRFARQGDTWAWSFEDLEPTLADDITVLATENVERFQDTWENGIGSYFIHRGDRWQREHRDYTVTASSTLAPEERYNYRAEHVRQYDYEHKGRAAWVEGADGQGIGEYLDLKPHKPLPLDAVVIHPGYSASPQHFVANSRPKKLDLTLNGEHTFTADLDDKDDLQTIPVSSYTKPVHTVRLTIRDVYPGTQFADTAITNVRLVSRLAKKPKLRGSR